MKKGLLYTLLAVWIAIWAFYIGRDLMWKGTFSAYRELLSRSLDGRRSYVTGDRLYEFIVFCRAHLPEGVSYRLQGIELESIDRRRFTYYLYPCREDDDARYRVVYDRPFHGSEQDVFARLDGMRYILLERE